MFSGSAAIMRSSTALDDQAISMLDDLEPPYANGPVVGQSAG